MSKEQAKGASTPKWDNWPAEATVGNCKITIFHSDESPPRALTLLAEPADSREHLGASLSCFLPPRDTSDVVVRPPISTYWSSRRRGPHVNKYFSGPYPKLEIAFLKSLSDKYAGVERRIAILYILLSGYRNEFELREEDNFPSLSNDDARFEEIANKWINDQSRTLDGMKRIEAARKHLAMADEWYQSLKAFDPSKATKAKRDSKEAKLTQSAIYKAILDSAVESGGVPLIGQVREAYRLVGLRWDEAKRKIPGKRQELHCGAFDTAIRNLGFSWLPRKWGPVK